MVYANSRFPLPPLPRRLVAPEFIEGGSAAQAGFPWFSDFYAYIWLYLPIFYCIYLVFHVSLLKPYKSYKGTTKDPLLGPIKLDNKGD